jgi:hypothetical protein
VLTNPGYRRHAETLAHTIRAMNGAAAERMWDFMQKL